MTPNLKNRGYLTTPPDRDQFTRVTLGILTARSGDRLSVKLTAALVATNATAFKHTIIDAIEAGVLLIELDLSACDHADRAGLGALVSAGSQCSRHEPAVAVLITGVSADLLVQLRHYQIDKLFAIQEPSPSEARRA